MGEVVQLMEQAIFKAKNGGCQAQRDILEGLVTPSLPVCQDAMEYWDAAAAIYTGSLEGPDGAVLETGTTEREYGKTFYTLADKRCRNFMTCGPNDGGAGTQQTRIDLSLPVLMRRSFSFSKLVVR